MRIAEGAYSGGDNRSYEFEAVAGGEHNFTRWLVDKLGAILGRRHGARAANATTSRRSHGKVNAGIY
jgi:hypothetical protein